MISGLPDRPLSHREVEALAGADALGFVLPATPNSLRDDADGTPRVYDLLIATGETVSAVAYDQDDGWIVVGTTDTNSPDAAVDDILAYRDYAIDDEEAVREFLAEISGTVDALSEEE